MDVSGISDLPGADDLPPGRYLDRDRSWVRFNQRVLELAEDDQVPLLERVRFLSVAAANLDEFFMVAVAALMRRKAADGTTPAGLALGRQLESILNHARVLANRHAVVFNVAIRPQLKARGIEVLRWGDLTEGERANLSGLFRERIYPILTPLVVDPARPFPFIAGLSLNVGVTLIEPATQAAMFARMKIPPMLPRFLNVSNHRYVPIEDVIAAHFDVFFQGMDVAEHYVFRVTRQRELDVEEGDATENLIAAMERSLLRRGLDPAVRLEVELDMSDDMLDRLARELSVDRDAVHQMPGPLDLAALSPIADIAMENLRYPPFVPDPEAVPADRSIFDALGERDILLHHPYDSFATTVQRLVEEAAQDPQVLAIKQTLYRTSAMGQMVDALIDAAEAGKQVLVVLEISGRFDERANAVWASKLEDAGCHVVYGLAGMPTHAKVIQIVRQGHDGTLSRYCHIGTGSYHPTTARLHEDLGLLTADQEVGEDITDLFNQFTGYSVNSPYRRLLVAPRAMRGGLITRIEQQAARARESKPARIAFKCNALVDEVVIDALYRASMAGVPIDIWVRGICALRPGVPGLSDTIKVRSVVGRFLEHSRVYAFGTDDDDQAESPDGANEVWLGSPDITRRHLDLQVESLVRVTDPEHCARLRELIARGMDDATASWRLGRDGTWTRRHAGTSRRKSLDIQSYLISLHQRHDGSGAYVADGTEPGPFPVSESTTTIPRYRGHAFISYVRDDSGPVDDLQRMLEEAGIPVWRDTDALLPGEEWSVKVREAITDGALAFIACFSTRSVARRKSYQNVELLQAIDQLRRRQPGDPWLIPVRFDNCDMPDYDLGAGRTLTSIQRADLFGPRRHREAERLVSAIKRIL